MSLALASAIMEGAIRGGASRQVAAAVASALYRCRPDVQSLHGSCTDDADSQQVGEIIDDTKIPKEFKFTWSKATYKQ